MNQWGVSPCCTNPPVAKAHHRNDTHIHQEVQPNHTLIPSPPRSSGVTIVGPTTAIDKHTHTHTTSQHQCAQDGRDTIDTCCAPWPDIATVLTRPTPVDPPHIEAMHKQHTGPRPSCCVPFGDPHVHKVTPSNETKQECSHSSANTWVPVHHMARTHRSTTSPNKEKEGGVHQQRVLC